MAWAPTLEGGGGGGEWQELVLGLGRGARLGLGERREWVPWSHISIYLPPVPFNSQPNGSVTARTKVSYENKHQGPI